MKRPAPAPGSPADVAAEFRLHGLRAAPTEHGLVLRNTPVGDIEAWVRPDDAHFFDPLGYPASMVPVVDVDLWEQASPRPRLLLVVSRVTRVMLVCSPRKTYTSWVRLAVSGPRGFAPAFTCPREQLKSFSWLKTTLL